MQTDSHVLRTLAQTYFDAAYAMDADRFSTIFHPDSSITRTGDDGLVSVVPFQSWLKVVREATSPQSLQLERRDEIVTIDVDGDLALIKIRLQMPPRQFTDLLCCLKVQGAWKIVQKVMRVEVAA
ncbi:MAG: hypothetical protein EON90_04510 [Brevundimonas sp.]|nr:MAG: hypothetical protein EON90_04510 [Brevundimonas sp.]